MTEELKKFIQENQGLINLNTKESWEQIYNELPWWITSEFTQTILDARVNDPAEIMGYIPENYFYKSKIENYRIPNSVISIGKEAFSDCYSLTSIVIPDSVTSIGKAAFSSCDSLTSVEIGDSVKEIGNNVFSWCDSLTSVVIPNSVTLIGDYAFYNCENLTSVVIGDGVSTIGWRAFESCRSLKTIYYKGTKTEWHNIRKERHWGTDSPIQKIICTDGVIEL